MTRQSENWKTAALGLLMGVAILGGLAKPSHAAVEVITCPASQVTGQIVNHLPTDWWTTPVRNSLQSVRVANSGGNTYLICDYGSAGFIQREAPAGANCRARGNRFRCETAVILPVPIPIPVPVPAPVPAPAPSATTANGSLGNGAGFDLDRGRSSGSTSDMAHYGALRMGMMNGATHTPIFATPPTRRECNRAAYGGGQFTASLGASWCVRTNEGNLSIVTITSLPTGDHGRLGFSYTTWR